MTTAPNFTPKLRSSNFYIWMIGIFVFSLAIRFWGLERFNTFVFDEIYYAKFANNYLTKTPFFNAHPPLSQYLIAIGIAIGEKLPFGSGVVNDLTGSVVKSWSYRWLNALTGSFVPLVVAGLAWQLTQRSRLAILAGVLSALDGLFLVESRYALNNIYLVLFGLLGQVCFLIAARRLNRDESWKTSFTRPSMSWIWMTISGFFLGCSASIKWNGLWFLITIVGIYALAWAFCWIDPMSKNKALNNEPTLPRQITHIPAIPIVLGIAIVPVLTYYVLWIPHIAQNPDLQFWILQQNIYLYHKGSSVIGDVHPYCSTWQTWLTMLVPVAYFYKLGIDPTEPIALNAPNIPLLPGASIYAVHAMGNPLLWWMTTAAIVAIGSTLLLRLWKRLSGQGFSDSFVLVTMMVGYGANLIPWMSISRCAFLYHYMGSSVFATLALAWWGDRALSRQNPTMTRVVWIAIGLGVVGFIFWMPIFLGLPLDDVGYRLRMWFPSWVEGASALKRKS
ncbi:MAG: phospholipid carrier-dependent glycosyltransferase [Cyanobacteria bacterium]|nr:phospholipid carrier-dependent glycosyltransferase [Cyanobacteriota bacterium]